MLSTATLGPIDGSVGQNAVQLAARLDVELGEDFLQVVFQVQVLMNSRATISTWSPRPTDAPRPSTAPMWQTSMWETPPPGR
jgi:hypothetical protein